MSDWLTILGLCGIVVASISIFIWPRIVGFIIWIVMPRGD